MFLLIDRSMLGLVFDPVCRKYLDPDVTTFNMFCHKTEFVFVAISMV